MKHILAVDVDLTVVDSLTPWLNWFFNKTGISITENHMTQYDLVPVMREECRKIGIVDFDPFDYWRDRNLYDMMAPIPGASGGISSLMRLYDLELVFVSHCVPEHESSKRLFLNRHFPKHHFISTSSKHFVDYDILIDDNKKIIELGAEHRPWACNVRFTQMIKGWDTNIPDGALHLEGWSEENMFKFVTELDNSKHDFTMNKG